MFTSRFLILVVGIILILNLFILPHFFKLKKKKEVALLSDSQVEKQEDSPDEACFSHHQEMLEKLDEILKREKLYIKCDLSLNEIAEILGTNRTYVSAGINSFYKQNFSSYLNTYRWDELQSTIQEDDLISNKELASVCGFGSVDSMKRIVKQKTGLSFKEWKSKICHEDIA